jgi:hypothetical protein
VLAAKDKITEMENKTQSWFEMSEIRKRFFDRGVWIPLKELSVLLSEGRIGYLGYIEEYVGVSSIAVPLSQRQEAEKLGWTDISRRSPNRGYVENGEYVAAHIYQNDDKTLSAEHLVLERGGNRIEASEWDLNQDLTCTLELKREGDTWLAISYGYEEVAKLELDTDGKATRLSIRASYLKDYLCARKMALYMTSYRSRRQIVEDRSHIKWDSPTVEETKSDKWEGRVNEISEGGEPFGSGYAVFHMSRTDVDYEEDIPEPGLPTDENIESTSWEGTFEGKKLFFVEGELWRNEWIEPAPKSPLVCEEELEPTVFFITDNKGKSENRKTLVNGIRWLWFNPSVIEAILNIRGSSLGWYTRDTGTVSCSPGYEVHFGINKIGLINVLAKDIALLPDWQQKVWAGYNVAPDGKVSAELLMSQMEARPASTQAPEEYLSHGFELLNKLIKAKFGVSAFKEHADANRILRRIHRFRAVTTQGLFELAKDIYRFVGEKIDASEIKKIVNPEKDEKWGQLKSLEKLLALRIGKETAYTLVSPLWGVYTLRLADSHLPSADISEAYSLCQIDNKKPGIIQGYQLIDTCVTCIYDICKALK